MHKRILLLILGALAICPAYALYDPKPIAILDQAAGTWAGTLTYRDYQKPDKMVTLKTQMTVSFAGPDELVLYYVFDDGPNKTVFSYERMEFDLASNKLVWVSGAGKEDSKEYKITSSSSVDGKSSLNFEIKSDSGTDQYFLEISKSSWILTKNEVSAGGTKVLRNKYEFAKT